jgi:hypothetical protein
VLILKVDEVVCFDTDLEVLFLKELAEDGVGGKTGSIVPVLWRRSEDVPSGFSVTEERK